MFPPSRPSRPSRQPAAAPFLFAAAHPRCRLAHSTLATAVVALLWSTAAGAQAPAAADASTDTATPAAGTLGEIVVRDAAQDAGGRPVTEGSGSFTTTAPGSTATGLGLSPRETPQAMTVVTRERIEQQGLYDLTSVLNATTGVYTSHADSQRYTYYARGYAINNYQVDGMLNTFGGNLRANGDMFVYDRVEVVRGAAGLMTGAGDPSAVVNQVRKRPTATFRGNAGVATGSYGLRRGEIDLSGPLAFDGKVRGRIVAAKEHAGSFRPLYETNNQALYGVLEADIGPATTASVGLEWQKSAPHGVTWGTVPYWSADGSVAHLPHNLNLSAPWTRLGLDEKKTFASIEHRFDDDWRVRAMASHGRRTEESLLYYGYGGYPRPDGSGIIVAADAYPARSTMDTVDVNAQGRFTAFGRRHDVMFGAGWSRRDGAEPAVRVAPMPASYRLIPDWRTWTGDVPVLPVTRLGYDADSDRYDQKAAFAATRLNLADRLKLVLGARVTHFAYTGRVFGAGGVLTRRTDMQYDHELTPYAGLLYDFAPDWTAYASYTDIFKPQTSYRDRDNRPLDPEVGKGYEAGVKGELFGRRLNVAAAVFRSKKDNVAQLDDGVPPNSLPGGQQAYRSTGKGNVIEGFELEASGQLARQWNVFAGASHTRSRDANGAAINSNVPVNLVRAFTTYRFGEGLRWTVGGGVSAQSSIWGNARRPTGALTPAGAAVTVVDRIVQDAVVTASLMAGYRINDQLSVTLNVNNLFNKHYYERVGFFNGVYAAEPRSARLTLRGTF